jgi:hypothetical protein
LFLVDPGPKFSYGKRPERKKEQKRKQNQGLWKLTPLMEIRKERGFPQRLEKDLAKKARLFTVPTGPTAAIHLKKGDFLSEEWGAPQSTSARSQWSTTARS